jgi:hypothetical protein
MISPNNGKVLLGADGNPLLGAAGKIVLADALYPMVPLQSTTAYRRHVYIASAPPPCAAEDVWDAAWYAHSTWNIGYCDYDISVYGTYVHQALIQTLIDPDSTIDWPRVKKLTQQIRYAHLNYVAGYSARITASQDNATLPEDASIRDSWSLGAAISSEITYPGTTLTLQWIIDGVRPDSVEFAIMFDTDVCASPTVATNISIYDISPVRVVYNLAEPTP